MKQILFLGLTLMALAYNSVTAQTKDPWIIDIYKELYDRQPDDLEVNNQNYNGGSWSSIEELKRYIQLFQKSKNDLNFRFEIIPLKDKTRSVVIIYENNVPGAAALLSRADGSIVSGDGASMVAGGAGSLIGQDGAALKDRVQNLGGVKFGSSNTLMSESLKPIKSGKGALIVMIKKKK